MNKNIIKIILVFISHFSVSSAFSQQDAQFSQYMFNGLYINPAYAGYREDLNLNMFYRTQWTGLPGAPKTFSIAADGAIKEGRGGLGIQAMNDQIGAQNNTSLYGNYAYRIPMDQSGDKTLAIGMGLGLIQQRLKVDALSPESQNDPLIQNMAKNAIMPDARAGIYYNSTRIFAGLSADNLVAGKFQESEALKTYLPVKPHMYLTFGGLVPLSQEVLFKPSFLVKEDLAGPTSFDFNAFFLLQETVWIGGSYRTAIFNKPHINKSLRKAGAIVGMIEYFVNEKLRIGYAYDKTINGTAANNNSSHEVSLNYIFVKPKARMLSPRYF